MRSLSETLSRSLTSRRGAWVSLIVGILVLVGLLGAFGRATMTSENQSAPPGSESARVAELTSGFADADERTLIAVASTTAGSALSEAQSAGLGELAIALEGVDGSRVLGPFPSDDGRAAVVQVTAPVPGDDAAAERALVEEVRAIVLGAEIDGVTVQVTGGPAFGVDVASSFDGADLTLLLVTIGIVAVLLIFTYRSPVLWLIPLTVVGIADQVASKTTTALGSALGLQFDTGIVSVLVFGAGTNYALLLISRYRERLAVEPITVAPSPTPGGERCRRSSPPTSPSSSRCSRSCSPSCRARGVSASRAPSDSSSRSRPFCWSSRRRWPCAAGGCSGPPYRARAMTRPRADASGAPWRTGSCSGRSFRSRAGSPSSRSWQPDCSARPSD